MEIKDRIHYYKDNLSLKTVKSDYVKLVALEKEIRRHIKKVIAEKGCVHFNSTDLKELAGIIGMVLSEINGKLEFSNIMEIIESKKQNITVQVFNKCMAETVEYMAIARELQQVYSLINYLGVVLNLLEIEYHQKLDDDSRQFSDELTSVIKEFLRGV